MMNRYSGFHRVIAYILSFVLLLGMIPAVSAPAMAEEATGNNMQKVADPATMDRWKAFFGPDARTTEYAGGVWTDKSVFTDASSFGGVSMKEQDSFMVALSAIAANQEIKGSDATPTDTVFVLDLSNSMDTSRSIPSMVSAANDAIEALLATHPESRVGVVLYSGNSRSGNSADSTATVLLPLDHYTTTGTYLTSTGSSDTTVSVSGGVRNSKNETVSGSKNTIGATYIQNGLFKAWLEFEDATVTASDGTARKPIIVLMSDGAPTAATTAFSGSSATSIGTSNVGNGTANQGENTHNRLTFLTQLTAAWVKAQVADHYDTAPLFYTLGLGTGTDNSATSVLNPVNSNTTVNGWWANYLEGETDSNGQVTIVPDTSWRDDNSWKLKYEASVTAKNYVDKYFYASQSGDLAAQFEKIIAEIQLQTASFPTLVEAGRQDLGGYITFEDELGVFMEVKDVKGIWLDGTLFSGANIAHAMTGSELGLTGTPTEAGYEYINTVMERIGTPNESAALQLINNAIAAGQISYTSDSEFSNYIGWYADANGNYLGFWKESYGIDGAPAGAQYINRSYAYLGDHNASDMMHVVVMVSTNIETGNQSVTFKIPASLIPMVTYKVDIDSDSLATATDIDVEYAAAAPMRLLFEVGLREDINELNINEKLEELLAQGQGGHMHRNDDGTYTFYTNRWGSGDGSHEIDYTSPLTHLVTSSHFHPAEENTRYYYTEPELICTDTNGTALTTAPVAGTTYYRAYTYITYNASGEGSLTTEYVPIAADIIADADNWMLDNGKYYVKAGSIYQETARFRVEKAENLTDTLTYADYPTVLETGDTAEDYNVYAFLGNNGKLTVTPAQGIKLTKTVQTVLSGAPTEFTFRVKLDGAVSAPLVTDENGDAFTGNYTVSTGTDTTEITVTLTDGQTVYITGIPTGTSYEVEEVTANDYYTPRSENSTGIVADQTISAVDFVNIPKVYGSLNIRKDVQHGFETTPDALSQKVFTFQVQLTGPDIAEGDTFTGADGTVYTVDAEGYLTAGGKNITLTDETFVLIEKIPEGTAYTVTEVDIPDGYTFSETGSTRVSGTITGDTTMFAHMVNTYTPTPLQPDVTLKGTKTVDNQSDPGAWPANAAFEIVLNQVFTDGTENKLASVQVTENAPGYAFALGQYVTITQPGTYFFRVYETAGTVDGMLYDVTNGIYRLTVTDENMDGTLEYTLSAVDNTATVTGNEGVKDFVNTYSAESTTVSIPISKVVTGHEHTPGGFLFTLTGAEGSYTATSDTNGVATVVIPYSKAGVYNYTLTETAPLVPIAGMIYSTESYTVTVTVTDQGGQLVGTVAYKDAQGNTVDNASFTNEYKLDPVDYAIVGNKTLRNGNTGAAMTLTEGQFSFSLYSTDTSYDFDPDKLLYTVTNKADGSFSFPSITYELPGTYRYVVAENAGTAPGYTYDSTLRYVTVVVTVNAETGKLEKAAHYWEQNVGYVDAMTLRNTYTVTGTATEQFAGSKQLTGKELTGGQFSFTLSENGTVLQTVRNKADGTFLFDPITYTAADMGTHTYTIAEVNDGKGGVTYDTATYTVTVTVADDGKGGLTVQRTADPTVVFNNSYKAAPTQLTLTGTKTLVGRELTANEFTFNIYNADQTFEAELGLKASVKNDAEGKFAFVLDYDTAGTYYYIVREDVTNAETGMHYDARRFRVTVHVTDDGNGNLGAVATIYQAGTFAQTIQFTNEYRPDPINVVIDGTKVLNGRPLNQGEFTFKLTDEAGNEQTTTNSADGSFSFELEELTAGTYTYTVSEVKGSLPGVTYDETVYTVTVKVEDVGGTLQATVTNSGSGALTFTNTYKAEATGALTVPGTKTLTGHTMEADEFTFLVYEVIDNGDGTYKLPETYTAVKNAADGSFTMELGSFDKAGTYWFVVKEQIPAQTNGITYDTTVYGIKVTVTDNYQTGKLELSYIVRDLSSGVETDAVAFVNTYSVTGTDQLEVTAKKSLTGRSMTYGEFTFQIKDQQGNVVANGSNQLDGAVAFSPITYTAADIGEHTYTVVEVKGSKGGVTYDETVYTIRVQVVDDGMGGVTASYTVEGDQELVFENSYKAQPTQITIEGTKQVTSNVAQARDLLGAGDYTFVLTDSQGNQVETTNGANGTFSFTVKDLTAGTYTYTVHEVKGSKGGITYDETVYTVTVTVTDNGDGTLSAGYTVDGSQTIAFTNTYTVTGQAELELTATKALTGRKMTAGEFTFHVHEGGALVSEGTNDANGVVTFKPITYTVADLGQHTYVVHEEAGNAGGMSYDSVTYTVVVYVTDDGEGNLQVVQMTVPQMTFSNSYTTTGTSLTLTGTKSLTGRSMEPGEFRFIVTDTAGSQVAVGTNTAAGVINFTPLSFDEPGTFTYYISEEQGDKGGLTYDQRTVTVTVTVVDKGDGTLSASYTTDTAIKFENTYETEGTQLVLTGTKTLTGRVLDNEQFTFHVYEGSSLVSTGKNDVFGKITFEPIKYTMDDIGTHTYRVNEVIGNAAGYGYDHTVYTVVVDVVDNGDGTLSVIKTRDPALSFHNTYTVTLIDVTLLGTKALTGRDLEPGEFQFELCNSMGAVLQTTSNGENGAFGFLVEDLGVGTHTYYIREAVPANQLAGVTYDNTVYEIIVNVTDNGDGTLAHTISVTGDKMVLFTNVYRPEITEKVTVSGTKTLTGRNEAMKPGEFTFTVRNSEGTKVGSAANDAQGNITVDLGSFSGAGTYTFTVTEDVPEEKHGITYDAAQYLITVTVTDDTKQGKLMAVTQITKNGQTVDALDFTNTYYAQPIDVELAGDKVLTGRDLAAGEFTFKLTDKDGNQVTTANTADGSFSFKLEDLSAGTYTYTIEEVKGSLGGVTYDDTKITATVTVTDDNKGNLNHTVTYTADDKAAELTFRNTYTVTGSKTLSLVGQKYLEGRGLESGEFSFKITENGKTVATGRNDANGKIAFETITYTADDIGQHFYVVSEDKGSKGGVEYDDTVYTVIVTVADNGKGGISVSYTVDGAADKQIVFNNGYSFEGSEKLTIAGGKVLSGDRTLGANDFSFVLKLGGQEIQTVKNNADGSFAFDELTFTHEDVGTHTYTVSEVNAGKGGYSYDSTVYTYTVTVVDNGEGGITVTKQLTAGGQTADGIVFRNTYTITGNGQTQITGKKNLTGDRKLAAGDFTFQLKDSTGALLEAVTNEADGTFKFSALTYTKADIGTHTYTVSEVNDGKSGYTYDAAVYTVTVEVKDNGAGGLTVTKTADPTIVFTNDYTITGSGEVTLKGTKKLTGKTLAAGDYTFELKDSSGAVVDTATNALDGSFSFKTLTYTKADIGTHTYTVSEVNDHKGGITYDSTVYTVTVTVADNGAGGLTVTSTGGESISFTNTYTITGTKTIWFVGTKQLIGKPMSDGEFTFVVMEGDVKVAEGTNDASGKIEFSEMEFGAEDIGTHTYTIYEVAGNAEGMTYDDKVYTVTIAVVDDGQGGVEVELVTTEVTELLFTNTFVPKDLNVQLDVNKTMVNMGTGAKTPEGFKFQLKDDQGTVVAEGTSDAQGLAQLAMTYKLEHVGTHIYTLTELDSGAAGVTYDKAVYTVTVVVVQGQDGQLAAQVSVTDAAGAAVEQVTFTNTYTPPATPPTGDGAVPEVFVAVFHISGLALSLMLAVLVIDTKKKKPLEE